MTTDKPKTYMLIRFTKSGNRRVLRKGLTLEEAQTYCKNPETSGYTCSNLRQRGEWFHGFEAE